MKGVYNMDIDEKVVEIIREKEVLGEITDLPGEGQATCDKCGDRSWCCFLYKYKGIVYCGKCLLEVIKNEYNL